MKSGFSLVELSIVLVILGLLTGGILAGQSLIRAAELRSVSTEYQRYATATGSFRDKYFAVPGDFNAATKFWNRQNATGDCVSAHGLATAGSPGACDGNANGRIATSGALQAGEMFQFWRHLALAGLVEGSYSGIAGNGAGHHCMIEENVPPSKAGQGGWFGYYYGTMSGDPGFFDGDYGNTFVLGAAFANSSTTAGLLRPDEMWNIDVKMDDGLPGRGRITPRLRPSCTVAADGTALTTSVADAAKTDAQYDLSTSTRACAVVFRQAF